MVASPSPPPPAVPLTGSTPSIRPRRAALPVPRLPTLWAPTVWHSTWMLWRSRTLPPTAVSHTVVVRACVQNHLGMYTPLTACVPHSLTACTLLLHVISLTACVLSLAACTLPLTACSLSLTACALSLTACVPARDWYPFHYHHLSKDCVHSLVQPSIQTTPRCCMLLTTVKDIGGRTHRALGLKPPQYFNLSLMLNCLDTCKLVYSPSKVHKLPPPMKEVVSPCHIVHTCHWLVSYVSQLLILK